MTTVVMAAGLVGCAAPIDDDDAELSLGETQQPLSINPHLPYPAGTTMGVSQGWDGSWSHSNKLKYAIDFNLPGTADVGIHVLAVADGVVTFRHDDCSCEGCDCNYGWGNAIVVDHGNGEFSKSTHLQQGSIPNSLQIGSPVCRGLHLGNIGNTGNSTGSHLHFQFQGGGGINDASIPFDKFAETSGVPQEGVNYTSTNQEVAVCGPPQPCSISVAEGSTVIDEQSDCFQRVGAWWWEESYGHDGHHWFTYTTDKAGADSSGRWEIHVGAAGDYQLEVFVPDNADSLSNKVPYTIRHDGDEDEVTVDQAANRGQWVALGSYHFAEGGDQDVAIFDNTGEPYSENGRRLLLDAVRLTSLDDGGDPGGGGPPDDQPDPGDGGDDGIDDGSDPADDGGGDHGAALPSADDDTMVGFVCSAQAPSRSNGDSPAAMLWLLLVALGAARMRGQLSDR